MNKNEKLKNYTIYTIIFLISALFYLVWYWHDGIIVTPDAQSYIDMDSARDPGYSVFLWICRVFAGWDGYQRLAIIMQCLLAAVAACALTISLKRRFSLNWLCAMGILVIQYGITLLNRFVAQRRYSYYNSIETEAITYSIWVFFFLALIGIIYDRNKRSIIWGVLWAIILMATRKQLAVSFIILFVCLVYRWWNDMKWIKAIIMSLCIVVFGFIGTRLVDCTYNYAIRGVFAPHTGDSSFILGTEVYVAREDMALRIDSNDNREIFLEILKRADELEYNSVYAGKGWHNIEDHYSESYDRIKFDIVSVVIREYQEDNNIPQDERDNSSNLIMSDIMKSILLPCLPGMIKIFLSNLVHGFVTTILKVNTLLNWVALFLYIAYIGLWTFLVKLKSYNKMKATVLPLAALVLGSIVCNVGFTSAAIYPQMRYMLYNTGLFYQAGLLMLVELFRIKTAKYERCN
jgi:hypothetical protein